jgi:hypothetical protein
MPDTTQALSNYLRTSVRGTDANPVLARSSPGGMNWTNRTADRQLVAASPGSGSKHPIVMTIDLMTGRD